MQYTWGDFWHTVDANADLTQQYRSNSHAASASRCPTASSSATHRCVYGERLNRDLGLYVQDSWRLNRLTVNAGIRWENIKAQVLASESPAGRFVPVRKYEAIQNLPNWRDWAPRFSAVLDVFGNGKTAVKYSVNRYNQIRTTGIAANYNPLLSQTATLPWRDKPTATTSPRAIAAARAIPASAARSTSRALSSNFGIAALNEFGDYPRTWNLENAFELQHEVLPGLSLSTAFFHGGFRNLTNDGEPELVARRLHALSTFYNPADRRRRSRSTRAASTPRAASRRATSTRSIRPASVPTTRSRPTRRGASPAADSCSAATRWNGSARSACTAPDDPNYLSATGSTDQRTIRRQGLLRRLRHRHPVEASVQALGYAQHRLGLRPEHGVPEQPEPEQHACA